MRERERGIERDNEGLGVSAGESTNLETPDQGGRQRYRELTSVSFSSCDRNE